MAAARKSYDYEDFEVGDELPAVERGPITYTHLVTYCGVSGVLDPVHFNPVAARAAGFEDMIANGSLRISFLTRCLGDVALPEGDVLKLTCQHRVPVLRGDAVTSRARVTRKYVEAGKGYLECEAWNETPRAGKTDLATALITLPLRGSRP